MAGYKDIAVWLAVGAAAAPVWVRGYAYSGKVSSGRA